MGSTNKDDDENGLTARELNFRITRESLQEQGFEISLSRQTAEQMIELLQSFEATNPGRIPKAVLGLWIGTEGSNCGQQEPLGEKLIDQKTAEGSGDWQSEVLWNCTFCTERSINEQPKSDDEELSCIDKDTAHP